MLDRIRHRMGTDVDASRPTAAFLRAEAGMTLIELVVAITLLAIIMLGLSASIGTAFQAVALGRQRQVAEAAANKRLEELRDVPGVEPAQIGCAHVPIPCSSGKGYAESLHRRPVPTRRAASGTAAPTGGTVR